MSARGSALEESRNPHGRLLSPQAAPLKGAIKNRQAAHLAGLGNSWPSLEPVGVEGVKQGKERFSLVFWDRWERKGI